MNSKEKLGMIIVLLCGAMWGLSGVLGEMLFIFGLMSVQYTYFAAVNAANAATATVLQYTYPILVLVCTSVLAKKSPNPYEIVAIVSGKINLPT